MPVKKQNSVLSSEPTNDDNPRAPSPSAALRAAKQQASARQNADQSAGDGTCGQPAPQHRPSVCGLNRSSTKKLLNLIKTKTKTDLTIGDGDENEEIDALLMALESETIENIDWDELGLDEDEVKDIVDNQQDTSSSSSEDEDEEEEEEEDESEAEGVEVVESERTTQHYVFRY